MERFIWSLDGIKLNDSKPLHFRPNERLRVTFVNDTMMCIFTGCGVTWRTRQACSRCASTRSLCSLRSA
jgi:hypothetical protein